MSNYNREKQHVTDSLRSKTNPFSNNADKSNAKLGLPTRTTSGTVKELHVLHKRNGGKRVVSCLDDSSRTPSSFVMPKKHKSNNTTDLNKVQEKSDYFDKKMESLINDKESEGKLNCPFCFTTFPFIPKDVQKALDKMEAKNKDYKEKAKAAESESGSVFCKPDALIQRPISSKERDAFCRLHRIEIVIKPQAELKGYPARIRFSLLRGRVKKLIPELENVVLGVIGSHYRDIALKAYDELGANKARSSIAVMSRFEDLLPGYYGPRGSSIISDILTDFFLASNILTTQRAAPQRPHEYIQQVLVPETGYRLIKEDYDDFFIDDDEARQIMKESVEYGEMINPLVDDDTDTSSSVIHLE
jgi:hypothetical protein